MPITVLTTNTIAFALSFAAWVLFGPSIREIAREVHLPLAMATLIKTLPVLVGSVMRVPCGILADRIGARVTFPILMCTSAVSVYALSFATGPAQLLCGAAAMGIVGATFVVGVQSVSSWTANIQRGFALGIFGSGNVGTSLTTFGLPILLATLGWRGAFRIYAAGLACAAAAYWLLVRDVPRKGPPLEVGTLLAPLKNRRTWRFGLYYTATFGVFVATTLTITDLYLDSFHMSLKTAGLLATTFTCAASLCRIPGGKLADRFGARTVLRWSLIFIVCSLTMVSFALPLSVTVSLVFASGLAMGIGMAAVFRYIPDYFPNTVGAVGGAVGALGGLGGFFLPQLSGMMKSFLGSPHAQLLPLAATALAALAVHCWIVRGLEKATIVAGLQALQSATNESRGAAVSDSVLNPTEAGKATR